MAGEWLAAAEEFAEAIGEHGLAAAGLTASAWRARVDPDATRSLLGAATALAGPLAASRAWGNVPPCASARDLLSGAEEIEGEVAGALKYARDTARACAEVLDAAAEHYQEARRDAEGAAARGDGAAAAAARERMTVAARVIGDCEAALDVLISAGEALRQAGILLLRVPADFEETYEEPLRFIAAGRKLPWDGNFITPGTAPAA